MPDEATANPDAALDHVMGGSLRSDIDRSACRGCGVSQIDAPRHFARGGRLRSGIPLSASTPDGCGNPGTGNLEGGVDARGTPFDFPRPRGVPYLEPMAPVYIEAGQASGREAGMTVPTAPVPTEGGTGSPLNPTAVF